MSKQEQRWWNASIHHGNINSQTLVVHICMRLLFRLHCWYESMNYSEEERDFNLDYAVLIVEHKPLLKCCFIQVSCW